MGVVLAFEENAGDKGHQSLVKESIKYAEEMGYHYNLGTSSPRVAIAEKTKCPRRR